MSQFTQKVLTFALKAGLESPNSVKMISRGVSSETYHLYDKNKKYIVVRFLQDEGNFRPNLLIKTARYFSQMGFPIPKVIATGQIDRKEAVMTDYAKGKVKPTWEVEDYESLGFLIGNLHRSGKQLSNIDQENTLLEDMTTRLLNLDDALPAQFKVIYKEIEEIEKQWPKNLPTGIIHGDIWYKNVFFENGKISAILDYTFPYNDCLVYDLATIMKGIYYSNNITNPDEKFNAFLNQYELANTLSKEEVNALPIMLKAKILYTTLFMLEQASLNSTNRESFLCNAMFNLLKLNETREISFEKTFI